MDQWEGEKRVYRSIKSQIREGLESAGRRGEGLECAKFAAQLELIPIILELPVKYQK